jgi:hypothetical protein
MLKAIDRNLYIIYSPTLFWCTYLIVVINFRLDNEKLANKQTNKRTN